MTIMTVRAPDALKNVLFNEAQHRGQTRNALILQILWEWVENQKEEPKC